MNVGSEGERGKGNHRVTEDTEKREHNKERRRRREKIKEEKSNYIRSRSFSFFSLSSLCPP